MSAPDSTDAPGGPAADAEGLIRAGDLALIGRMPWSSNATFLVGVHPAGSLPVDEDGEPLVASEDEPAPEPLLRAIYKPHRGERPLWDFPDGLWQREVAAFELARALGWDVVPETVGREGPFGPGSVQRFVDADFEQHYFTLLEDDAFHPQLRRMCAFDVVANSADRKGGHVLVDADRHLWGIDNGLCFHMEPKLRTVIWDFGASPLPAELADDLDRFLAAGLPDPLARLLDPFERESLRARTRALLSEGRFPTDPSGRRFPWPLV
ncbi:MAG: hypothetical protein JWM05_1352 [Acidimicrobiales bacterium]|nr:hypothetical protein [Acidimicrobiales bacterium]